jgi:hypothetical protein
VLIMNTTNAAPSRHQELHGLTVAAAGDELQDIKRMFTPEPRNRQTRPSSRR